MFVSGKPQQTPFAGPRWWQAGLVLAVALIAQIELMHFLAWHHAEPSLVLIAVVWYAVRTDSGRAVLFGLIAGACEDLFWGSGTGAGTGGGWTIATTLTALLVASVSQSFFADSIPIGAAAVAAATLFRRWIFWIVLSLEGYPRGYAIVHFHQALWEALMNLVAAAVLMLGARLIERRRA
jgi:rod shape-determining protein MreD